MSTPETSVMTMPDHLDPDLSAEAAQLRIATFRLARRMRTQRAVDSMHGPHTLGELAERERVSAPSMNRTVNSLQDAGYIGRTADESDGRKVVISLTDAGRVVVDETARRRDAWVEAALADLSGEERESLAHAAALMARMAAR